MQSLSMYQISVPVFVRGLGVLAGYLEKAEAYAKANNIDPAEMINAKLAPDMLSLAGQVQRASDTSKNAIGRLSAIEAPRFEDNEVTFAELQERVAKTIAFLDSARLEDLQGSETRSVTLSFGKFKTTLQGDAYLLTFTLPNFFFHITTAHDILRHKGVAIGKIDYLGHFEIEPA
ncbi:hypothetical protein SAMN04515618_11896 [Collimonas sp. OK307]|uniref:DUF1993 domain-containing protein n=1 Tax=Collimonas sp. OK307 TaxID=1801620 RepID=UPI0008F2F78A|nr:DUF1993 domain-containing protein [Collimonas sp. OK307]SFI34987.1 hypothetical protein SAMN04515618_11896 [Collimonas sp. OK307]